jgi:hypothetical protein
MANNYHWSIETMDVIPNSNGLTYVVDRIGWQYHGTDPVTNKTDYVGWSTKLGEVEGEFIEYSSLTEAQVLSWVKNHVSGSNVSTNYMDHINGVILKEIASKKWTSITVSETDLPWSPTSGSSITPQVSDPAPV